MWQILRGALRAPVAATFASYCVPTSVFAGPEGARMPRPPSARARALQHRAKKLRARPACPPTCQAPPSSTGSPG
ncbi:unnamed protein product [Amoebophrya sp. A120]|nr:unnamed protein product [Amoebophrya sp. A120]|eukprot:GSA120T00020891001.1